MSANENLYLLFYMHGDLPMLPYGTIEWNSSFTNTIELRAVMVWLMAYRTTQKQTTEGKEKRTMFFF